MKSTDRTEQPFDNIIEEYLTKLDQGENPNPKEFAQRYPEHAKELLQFLNNMLFLDNKIEEEHNADLAQKASAKETITQQTFPEIAGFTILEEIGGGSQGTVFKALQAGTNRNVAIKVIREGAFATNVERARFENEAKLVSQLTHPNIVVVHSYGHAQNHAYFAMEYVEGASLDIFMSTQTLEIPETLHLFRQICDGMNHAHINGVIHRDIKPSNIIVDENNQIKIVDFGLAKKIFGDSYETRTKLTMVGQFAGTWQYASPEQVLKNYSNVDTRSDIYALGVILYEMLTDLLPYPIANETRSSIENHIINTIPQSLSYVRREIDRDLDTIVLKTLHKEPERRYQSVAALLDDISRYMDGHAIEARRDSTWYVLHKTVRRYKWRVAAAAISFVTLLVFSITISILYTRANSARATTELRSRIVHDSQRYTSDKLDELTIVSNRLNEIIDAHPDLPEIQRHQKDAYLKPLEFFEPIVKDMPADIYESVKNQQQPAYDIAVQWLMDHSDELDQVVRLAKSSRLVFDVDRSASVNLEFYNRLIDIGYAEQVCQALLARAMYQYQNGKHKEVIDHLNSARSIALDIGDSRMLFQKRYSVVIRSLLYDTVLYLFNDLNIDSQYIQGYIDWDLQDPPIVPYRLAMISERLRISQLIEVASVSDEFKAKGFIDLDLLNQIVDGYYKEIGMMSDEMYTLSSHITPDAIMQDVDTYFKEVEQWDPLNYFQLESRNKYLTAKLNNSDSFMLVQPLLSTYKKFFQYRSRVCTKRNSTLIVAYLIRFRKDHHRWPNSLTEAIPQSKKYLIYDPYIGDNFGYKIVNNKPLLYSINEDGVDNDGHHGDWGSPGTDVLLFNPHK